MRDIAEELKQRGAILVAIGPQLSEHNRAMREKHGLNFDMLHDPGNAYAKKLGLRFSVAPKLREIYAGFGIDLPASNGDESWTLPIPARLVVDQSGIVRAADIDPDYTRRPEPGKTLEDVRALGQGLAKG